jgi:hypothetical protein|tara:strand:+ start:191 stop:904 length:714 start_codon:yes stop_codon:yes gene_type:complete
MYKGIFIHVPKAAGTSMLEAFEPYKEDGLITDHSSCLKRPLLPLPINAMFDFKISSAALIRGALGAYAWKRTFKFCFVRNPWDRYVSNWHWLTRTGQRTGWTDRGWRGNDGEITFEDFVHQIGAAYEMPIQGYQHDKWHVRNQIEHMADQTGNIMVDYVGRVENIEKDFAHVCNEIGYPDLELPHTNHVGFYEGKERKKEPHYSTHYTPELVEIVRERSKADIEAFDYTFEWVASDE